MELVVALIGVLVVHEVGHIVGTWIVGGHVLKVGVNWTGVYVRARIDPPCMWKARVSMLSGVFANLAMGIVSVMVMPQFAMLNFYMGVLNLAFPVSDGWRAWRLRRT